MACAASTEPPLVTGAFDLDAPWTLSAQVALRPERFGALAYDFATRKLSFLKSRALVDVVRALAAHPSAREACGAAGVEDGELARYEHALATLARSGVITARAAA